MRSNIACTTDCKYRTAAVLETWFISGICIYIFFFGSAATQRGSWPPHSRGFLDHTQRCTTVGRTPLDG